MELSSLRRHYGDEAFAFDSRYGAYGGGNKAASKRDAQERAARIRASGRLARVTLEQQDYGRWWVVWAQLKGAAKPLSKVARGRIKRMGR